MPMSVRLDATLEARVEQEARRRGVTKSALVIDALERALGLKDPARLLREIRSLTPMGAPSASEDVSAQVRAKLRAKRSD
ncbi:ribbon-helix-helix protein, CopG family [Candidatus Fermentibacteria bacterium]|nr:ribbon-helix-helix protein, CopG family [Candidatus Fermentibacteria bacterium]